MKNSDSGKNNKQIYIISILIIVGLAIVGYYFIKPNKSSKPISFNNTIPDKITEPQFINEGSVIFSNGDSIMQTVNVEIADEEAKITQGLMYRSKMDEKQGMIFIFPEEVQQNFWMKNTILPLDLIFIDKNWNVVSIQKYAIPYNESGLPSEGPAKYVVEVNSGFADRHNIRKGTKAKFLPSRKLML